ncbi:hypothetical protein TSUD_264580 [Trifolium subterraneum]|uniref:Uncharacterized protein n=1 Tax=Trifolium subterraneum TaxID=3900 RepID=A0A2Z6MY24_TRISU|nr:hypothetical protein TSUD_264580 [Trifolium subterraneum]
MAANMDFAFSDAGDMPEDKTVSISSENESVSDSKNRDVVDKVASGKAYKNVVISSGDKNRICRLFIKLPSLVRADLISRPFWFSLVSILVWIICHGSKKRSSPILRTRYTQRGKWLVDCAQKFITYKKANKDHILSHLQS